MVLTQSGLVVPRASFGCSVIPSVSSMANAEHTALPIQVMLLMQGMARPKRKKRDIFPEPNMNSMAWKHRLRLPQKLCSTVEAVT